MYLACRPVNALLSLGINLALLRWLLCFGGDGDKFCVIIVMYAREARLACVRRGYQIEAWHHDSWRR